MSEQLLSKVRTLEQFDGSRWRYYESPESHYFITSQGRELLAHDLVYSSLRRYMNDFVAGREGSNNTRQLLAVGSSARVFSVGDLPLVVKESKSEHESLLAPLHRMDKLVDMVQTHCPRWIDIPKHYGILIPRKINRHFMLMQKIDHGVTVGDIIPNGDLPHYSRVEHGLLNPAAIENFGPITSDFQVEIYDRFIEMQGELRKGLMQKYLSPDEYLPDLDTNPYNVALEKLETPVAGSLVKFWVIDQ